MKGYLSDKQINYVLFHLNFTVELIELVEKKLLSFCNDKDGQVGNSPKIFFKLSSQKVNFSNIYYHNNLPILFPLGQNQKIYGFKGNNLIFNHDLLKSVFYLLSGYQETQVAERDIHERYPYKHSIQKKLDITGIPLVNYYFEWIAEGIEKFCRINNLLFKRKTLFAPYGFNLTHDVDQVDFFTIKRFLYKFKELSGMAPATTTKPKIIRQIFETGFELLKFGKKENPSWNFDQMLGLEQKYNFRSNFYFLAKDLKNQDADYSFDDPRLTRLYDQLKKAGCEIGVHGTVMSAKSIEKLSGNIMALEKYSKTKVYGGRQHRLIYFYPETLIRHKKAGLKYDTGLGFAEHEGFRNNYCLPFKPYDFEKDQMIDIWEIPLNVMDVTLFYYRKLNPESAFEAVKNVIEEVKKFNGVFTLLWHNGAVDEDRFPGIEETYEKILAYIYKEKPESLTGFEIVKKMELLKKHA